MLFEETMPPELLRSMQSLEGAYAELGVPWPYDEKEDMALLTRIKTKYPQLNVGDLVDDFLVWCVDARPWEDKKGKPQVVRWKQRLWTRARNQIEYGKKNRKNRTTTHYFATERSDENQILDEW